MPYPTVGAVPPPPGVTPNFQHPQDAGRMTVLVGNIVCITAVDLAFLLRSYVKYSTKQPFTIEDWLCTVAWILITLYSAVGFMMYKYGLGFHAWDLSTYEFSHFLKWLYIQSLLYGPTIFSTKATLLFLISRVCSVRRTISRGINLFIFFLVTCYVPLQIVKVIVCLPVQAFWNPEVREKTPNVKCLRQGSIFIADSCIALVTDATILLLPIILVWSMRLPLYKKAKAALLLGAGGVAVAVTAYRVPLLFQYELHMDVTSGFVTVGLLTTLEQTIGFVCACLPFFNLIKYRRTSRRRSRLMANVPRTSNRESQGTSRDTYGTSWQLEATESGGRRDGWLVSSSTTREPEQNSENRMSRVASEEGPAGSPLPKPDSVLVRDRIWDGPRE